MLLEQNDCSYLSNMTEAMQSMVFAISNWGSDGLDWLQHGACSGSCDSTTNVNVFRNIEIYTQEDPEPPTPEPPTPEPPTPPKEEMDPLPEFVYTTKCGKNKLAKANKCGADCENCFWSWPASDADKGRSTEAACRCLPDQMAPDAYDYIRACKNSKAGTCQGCDTC